MQIRKFIKKNYKKILSTALVAAITVSHCSMPSLASESNEYTLKERFALAKKLEVLEYMEDDGYLSDEYAHPLSFAEMSSGVGPLLRISDFDEILENEELYRVYPNMEMVINGQGTAEAQSTLGLMNTYDASTISSYYIATYNVVSHSNGLTIGSKFTAYTPAGLIDVFCGEHETSTPLAGDALTNITEITNSNVLKALYYGYGGPGAIEGKSSDFYLETANAASYYIDSSNSGYASTSYRAILSGKSEAPNGFKVYTSKTNGGSTQNILFSVYEPEGYLKLTKSSSNTSITNGSSCYSLTGAQYGVYTTKTGATNNTSSLKVGTLTTTSTGTTNTLTLEAGTYYVKETKAPTGYQLDPEVYTVTVSAGGTNTLSVTDEPYYDPIGMVVTKVDADTGTAITTGAGELAGAEFTVKFYNTQGSISGLSPTRTWVFETGEDGKAVYDPTYLVSGSELYYWEGIACLPLGTITIQETKAPTGYLLDPTVYTRVIELDASLDSVRVDNVPEVAEEIIRGGVKIQKFDNETGQSTPQGNATFESTTYEIVNNTGSTVYVENKAYSNGAVVKTLVADANGYVETASDLLPYGDYAIRETKAPAGYLLSGVVSRTFTITTNGAIVDLTSATTGIRDNVIRGGVSIEKRDIETGLLESQGNTTFEGVEFTIYSSNESIVVVDGEEYSKGDAVATLVVKDGVAKSSNDLLPYGTYTVEETKEPVGYFGTSEVKTFTIYEEGVTVELHNDNAFFNQVKRGDLDLTKIEGYTMQRMENIPFQITSKTTGESYVIVTDVNGYASTHSSWNPHSQNTNRGETDEDGVWFGDLSSLDNDKGALIYDTYIIEELPSDNNSVHDIFEPFEITISRDSYTVGVGTVTNELISIDISTYAYNLDGEGKYINWGDVATIVDEVTYKQVPVGFELTMVGILMNKSTGKEILTLDGETITAETVFVPEEREGSVDVFLTVDTAQLDLDGPVDMVVYEYLYYGDTLLAKHDDIDSLSQRMYVQEVDITTEAVDGEDGDKILSAGEEVTVIDKVTMEGLIVGKEYTVKGILMDKLTGEAFLVDEEEVEAELTFIADASKQVVELEFTFDSKGMLETTLVVFENLYSNDRLLAAHTDIEDEAQTVVVKPITITTEAVESENESHTSFIRREVTIIDTVTMEGLIVGREYTVKGVLMDKSTGEAFLVDGEEVRAELTFTAEAVDQVVELAFTFDSKYMEETTLVVFETLYRDDLIVATHEDINDEAQSVEFVERDIEIDTVASAPECYEVGDVVEVKDIVTYTNVFIDEEYTIKGVLMDKLTEEVFLVNGEEVVAELTFIPEEEDGEVELTFKFEITEDMADLHLVVFETMFDADGNIVAEHTDIDDEDQTVYIEGPELDVPNKPKTGDDTNVRNILLLCGLSALAGVVIFKRRKNDNK